MLVYQRVTQLEFRFEQLDISSILKRWILAFCHAFQEILLNCYQTGLLPKGRIKFTIFSLALGRSHHIFGQWNWTVGQFLKLRLRIFAPVFWSKSVFYSFLQFSTVFYSKVFYSFLPERVPKRKNERTKATNGHHPHRPQLPPSWPLPGELASVATPGRSSLIRLLLKHECVPWFPMMFHDFCSNSPRCFHKHIYIHMCVHAY